MLAAPEETARSFVKMHGRHAADVMTHPVISVNEETPIQEIAEILEKHRIKRVPVISGDKLVGIVSRANLLRPSPPNSQLRAPPWKTGKSRRPLRKPYRKPACPAHF